MIEQIKAYLLSINSIELIKFLGYFLLSISIFGIINTYQKFKNKEGKILQTDMKKLSEYLEKKSRLLTESELEEKIYGIYLRKDILENNVEGEQEQKEEFKRHLDNLEKLLMISWNILQEKKYENFDYITLLKNHFFFGKIISIEEYLENENYLKLSEKINSDIQDFLNSTTK